MRRKPNDPQTSQLAKTFKEAMRIAEQMKADGASKEDREAYIAGVLKASWPKGREEPWRYLCEACDDSGWVIRTCVVEGQCGRPFTLPGQASDDWTGRGRCAPGHTYAAPCSCPKGEEKRRQLLKQPRRDEDAIAVAAKTGHGKPSGFQKAGR